MIIKEQDLYTNSATFSLMTNTDTIGTTTIQYEVRRYVDVRNLKQVNGYVVTCTQRFAVANATPFAIDGGGVSSYVDYPALITNGITCTDDQNIVSGMILIDCEPKTLNTSVTTSQNQSATSGSTSSQQYTSGSSFSQTNSFGWSLSAGSFGAKPTDDFGINRSRSHGSDTSTSSSFGSLEDSGSQSSSDISMAIKDWGGFVQLDKTSTFPTWIWAQEYPWDLINFRSSGDGDDVDLPEYVQNRLYDGQQLYPPSELSQFGVSFASKVSWLVTLDANVTDTTSLAFNHALELCVATHQVQAGELVAKTNANPAKTHVVKNLDLPVLALDPIGGDNGPALVGFIPGQFDVAPTSAGGQFVIAAESNLMLIRGSGFTAVSQSGFMTTDFSTGSVTLTLYFKVLETSSNVSLSLKHWVGSGQAVELDIAVNDGATTTKRVDGLEAGGGGTNVTVVPLRRKDFSSVDFCDLLSLGLNKVTLTFSAEGASADYTLMAVAVG
jgi:hypothetical protein